MSNKDQFQAVEEFMRAMNQEIPPTPQIPSAKIRMLRADLIGEEVTELFSVLEKIPGEPDLREDAKIDLLVDIADAVADIMYVVAGTASAFGIPGSEVFKIVHEANMKKLDGPVRPDGKRLKPEGWEPPEPKIRELIQKLRWNYSPPVDRISGSPWEGDYGRTC